MLQRVNEMAPSIGNPRTDQDRQCYESIIIVLDTLEKCLVNQPRDTTKYDEAMNVKLLLREICQFIGERDCLFFFVFFLFRFNVYMIIIIIFIFFFFYEKRYCLFTDIPNDIPQHAHLKNLASKVLFALSLNFFSAVFNRISARLQELSNCGDENPDYSDIELIQHINIDLYRLTKLLNGTIGF